MRIENVAKEILIRGFVIACGPAGLAVHQPIRADANVQRGLAETAEFVAFATVFRHLALCTAGFGVAASSGHSSNVSPSSQTGNVPLVTPNAIYNP
jgi:hypothetical protein